MEPGIVTVGQLRAELVGWPDDLPVLVFVPDQHDPHNCAVRPIATAGVDDLSGPEATLATAFPLTISPRSAF